MRRTITFLALGCAALLVAAGRIGAQPGYALLIRGGRVLDSAGGARTADVAIDRGRIAAIGELSAARSKTVIEARGQLVAPGFIDVPRTPMKSPTIRWRNISFAWV